MEHPFSQLEVVIEKINYLFGQMKNDASNKNLGNKVELSLLKKYGTTLYDRIIDLEKIAGGDGISRKASPKRSSETFSFENSTAIEREDTDSTAPESKKILFAEAGSRIMRRVKKINTLSGENIEIHDDDIIEEGTINEYVQPKDNILTTETILLPNSKLNDKKIVEAEEPVAEKLIHEAKKPVIAEIKIEVVKEIAKKKKKFKKKKSKSKLPISSIEQQGIKDFNQPEALTFEIDLKQADESKTINEKAALEKSAGIDQILDSLSAKAEVEPANDSKILPKAALAGIAGVIAAKSSSEKLLETILGSDKSKVETKPDEQANQGNGPLDEPTPNPSDEPVGEQVAESFTEEASPELKDEPIAEVAAESVESDSVLGAEPAAEAVNKSVLEEKLAAPKVAPVQEKEEEVIKTSKNNFFQIDNNQKLRFTVELFKGEQEAYQETLTAMSECSNVIEAYTYVNLNVKGKYNWDSDSPTVKEFQKIVKDKFLA